LWVALTGGANQGARGQEAVAKGNHQGGLIAV
jgi:hypothetical protein